MQGARPHRCKNSSGHLHYGIRTCEAVGIMQSDRIEMERFPEDVAASVLDSLVDAVIVIDDAGVILWTNQAWRDSAALSDAEPEVVRGIGLNYLDDSRISPEVEPIGALTGHTFTPSAQLIAGIRTVIGGECTVFESEHASPSPSQMQWFLVTATALDDPRFGSNATHGDDRSTTRPVVISIRNITERKIEEERRAFLEVERNRAARSRSMGRLAGGVAHNLNNMLGVILGHTDLALNSAEPDDPLCAELHHIRDASERAARLIRQLLTYAGRQRVEPERLDLGATVADLLPGVRRRLGADISVSLHTGADLWPVDIDPLQVDLIVTNLCANARDAIDNVRSSGVANPGKIEIEIDNTVVEAEHRVGRGGAGAGDYVRLTVRDNGCGIPPDVLSDIFDPFFTTKETARGMGLGLASVHGAVTQCGGGVAVESDGRSGATFEVLLPRRRADEGAAICDATDTPAPDRTETILIVDDEPGLLRTAARALTYERYNVLTAASAEEAIRVAAEHQGRIHLLVTDVLLPKMGGRDLIDTIAVSRPGLPHLFMSGYSSDIVTGTKGVRADDHFIAKPFRIDDLATKVREILDQHR